VIVSTERRLECLGNGVKMDDERAVKKLLEGKPNQEEGRKIREVLY
jgi:hypothetical protein